MADLLPTATLTAREIDPPAPASPFAIDPNRTQELPPSSFLTATLTAVTLAPPSPPSPWTIDPQRTQEITP